MALSQKKKDYDAKYFKENYKQVKLSMPNAEAEALEEYCATNNLSKAGFIRQLIKEAIEQGTQSTATEQQPQQEATQPQDGTDVLVPSKLPPVDGTLVLMQLGPVSVDRGEMRTLYTAPETGREYYVEPVMSDDEWDMLQKAKATDTGDPDDLPF